MVIITELAGQSPLLPIQDVIITFFDSSCSGTLEIALTTLANAEQNALILNPGFALFKSLLGSLGVQMKGYKLLVRRRISILLE